MAANKDFSEATILLISTIHDVMMRRADAQRSSFARGQNGGRGEVKF